MGILRLSREPVKQEFVRNEAEKIASIIHRVLKPKSLFLFGSAARGEFTSQSDFDFLLLYSSGEDLRKGQKLLRSIYPISEYPVELVWMLDDDFATKMKIGGLPFIVAQEGIQL